MIKQVVYFINFCAEVLVQFRKIIRRGHVGIAVLQKQILFTGIDAFTIISLTALVIGGLIIIQGNTIFVNLGNSSIIYTVLVSVVTRELGTFIPALIIVARSGTAITTELGNMVVNNEINALTSMGISPVGYLVVPRIAGVVLSVLPLSVYFNIIALLAAGAVYQVFYDVIFLDFIFNLAAEIELNDILIILIKSVVFGYTIALLACFHGLQVMVASTEVPQRTSKAVVHSIASVIVFDIIITVIFYFM
ncbi:MAG: hypothetical protein SCALA702_22660 [Melioribacteraceae bacterium]|nr:MAG: hypothetical protein SCALA702_22660 [Melioribacteraceae bacterium]